MQTLERAFLDGIDLSGDDEPVHWRQPGTDVAWCGVRLTDVLELPEDEVTAEASCRACLTAERLALELTRR